MYDRNLGSYLWRGLIEISGRGIERGADSRSKATGKARGPPGAGGRGGSEDGGTETGARGDVGF